MIDIQASLPPALTSAHTRMYILRSDIDSVQQAQKILLFPTKDDIRSFLVVSSDVAYLVNPTRKCVAEIKESVDVQASISGPTPPLNNDQIPVVEPAQNPSELDGALGYARAPIAMSRVCPTDNPSPTYEKRREYVDEPDEIIPPTSLLTTTDTRIDSMLAHEHPNNSNNYTSLLTQNPTAFPAPLADSVPLESLQPDNVIPSTDHLNDESSCTANGEKQCARGTDQQAVAADEQGGDSFLSVMAEAHTSVIVDHDDSLVQDPGREDGEKEQHPLPEPLIPVEEHSTSSTLLPDDMISNVHTHGVSSPTDQPLSESVDLIGTAADFYRVDKLQWDEFAASSKPGSALYIWANSHNKRSDSQENGKLENEEPDETGILEPHHPDVLLRDREHRIRIGDTGEMMPAQTDQDSEENQKRIMLFDRSEYPPPWPLIPFSYLIPQYLEHRIPHRYLPKSLVVHDPWNMLAVDSYNEHGYTRKPRYHCQTWMDRDDIIHEYDLKLSSNSRKVDFDDTETSEDRGNGNNVQPDDALRVDDLTTSPLTNEEDDFPVTLTAAEALKSNSGYLFYPENTSPGPIYPPIFVTFDLPSQESSLVDKGPQEIEKAHLYISAHDFISYGHHSSVLEVEMELPRSAIIRTEKLDRRPRLCVPCIKKALEAKLEDLDGEKGEKMDDRWKEKSAMLKRSLVPKESSDSEEQRYKLEIEGPVRPIRITLKMHDHKIQECEYTNPPPPSAIVRVVAKLSNVDDDHLDREADCYQSFPQAMFEHRKGTYTLPGEAGKVPMGAVVPQFYGYYSPRKKNPDDSEIDHQKPGHYLSRILLLEFCGRQIAMNQLTLDEKKSCAALVARFHDAGWSHESIFRRNFLRKAGPITLRHSSRGGDIFRLADFGRSYHVDSGVTSPSGFRSWERSRKADEEDTDELFGVSISRSSIEEKL